MIPTIETSYFFPSEETLKEKIMTANLDAKALKKDHSSQGSLKVVLFKIFEKAINTDIPQLAFKELSLSEVEKIVEKSVTLTARWPNEEKSEKIQLYAKILFEALEKTAVIT
jgi:hypothetical protein